MNKIWLVTDISLPRRVSLFRDSAATQLYEFATPSTKPLPYLQIFLASSPHHALMIP
jgi:hypothetical protein